MNERDALRILEEAKDLIDTAVFHAGSFSSIACFEQTKQRRKEYKAAVKFLQKEFIKRAS